MIFGKSLETKSSRRCRIQEEFIVMISDFYKVDNVNFTRFNSKRSFLINLSLAKKLKLKKIRKRKRIRKAKRTRKS